ncbi:unnamed protein product [Linum trigynum]|uniref:Uncharacterized protein n=1 Tax=Linum trigynum TaxID=586398 RepID=A0AAV2EAQ0_9ROSI
MAEKKKKPSEKDIEDPTEKVPSPFAEPPSSSMEPTPSSKGEVVEPTPVSVESPTPVVVETPSITPTLVTKETPTLVAMETPSVTPTPMAKETPNPESKDPGKAPVTYQRRNRVPSTTSSALTVEVLIEGGEGDLTHIQWRATKTPRFERSKRKPEVLSDYVLSNIVTSKLDPLQNSIVEFALSTTKENDSVEFVETAKCKVCRLHLLSLKCTTWVNRVVVEAFGYVLQGPKYYYKIMFLNISSQQP